MTESEAQSLIRNALLAAGLSDPFVLGLFGGMDSNLCHFHIEVYASFIQRTRPYLMEAAPTVSSAKKTLSSLMLEEHSMDTTVILRGYVYPCLLFNRLI